MATTSALPQAGKHRLTLRIRLSLVLTAVYFPGTVLTRTQAFNFDRSPFRRSYFTVTPPRQAVKPPVGVLVNVINRAGVLAGESILREDLAASSLKAASHAGAQYADVRVVTIEDESLQVKKGVPEEIQRSIVEGLGVRVLYKGAWGFAGSSTVSQKIARETARKAFRIARASSSVKRKDVRLAEEKTVKGSYATSLKLDPFKVPLKDKLEILTQAERILARQSDRIKTSASFFRAHRERKHFVSTDGSRVRQTIVWCGGGISATAIQNGDVQDRSYPSSFRGNFRTAGYEFFQSLDLVNHSAVTANEAVSLLSADKCPSTMATLIITGDQLALQLHESCGHATELDRVLGMEADFAGTSFMTPEKLRDFKYGSAQVSITADATVHGGLGTFGFDDEGVPGRKVELVKEGLFVGYQSSRETAATLGLKQSSGGMRAQGPLMLPLIRMTNINLLPGDCRSDEIIEDTQDGILMMTNRSWSIDDKRLNFQFGTEVAWTIKNGSKDRLIKNATYTGIAPEVWGSCDAVSKDDWAMHGTPNCGKGVPPQTMYVGHGVSTARFRNVRVGILS